MPLLEMRSLRPPLYGTSPKICLQAQRLSRYHGLLRKLGRPSWSSLCFSRCIGGGVRANNWFSHTRGGGLCEKINLSRGGGVGGVRSTSGVRILGCSHPHHPHQHHHHHQMRFLSGMNMMDHVFHHWGFCIMRRCEILIETWKGSVLGRNPAKLLCVDDLGTMLWSML